MMRKLNFAAVTLICLMPQVSFSQDVPHRNCGGNDDPGGNCGINEIHVNKNNDVSKKGEFFSTLDRAANFDSEHDVVAEEKHHSNQPLPINDR